MSKDPDARAAFVIARNPEEDSKLPYLIRLPIEGGLALKAHDTWPRSARVYCHPFEEGWPPDAEVLEETPVASCRRRGAVIDLVLDRPRLARSQFVFTETRGRPAIFWQTQKTARAANPGARVPRARAIPEGFQIAIDTRERYPYRFSGKGERTERLTLAAGGYAVGSGQGLIAVVERKVMDNFCASLSDGTPAFQMQRLSELQAAAVVVEGRYWALFKLEHVPGAWLADVLARLQVRLSRGSGRLRRLAQVRRGVDLPIPRRGSRRCNRCGSGVIGRQVRTTRAGSSQAGRRIGVSVPHRSSRDLGSPDASSPSFPAGSRRSSCLRSSSSSW